MYAIFGAICVMIRPVFIAWDSYSQAPSVRAFPYMFSLHIFRFIVGAITLNI